MENQQLYKIYYLKCPFTEIVKYVGVSNNPNKRFIAHCSNLNEVTKKTEWLKFLKSKNKKPILEIVQECKSKEEASIAEVYHISLFGIKNLYNSQIGGYYVKPKNKTYIDNITVHKICKLIVSDYHDQEIKIMIPEVSKSSISAIRAKRMFTSISDLYFDSFFKSSRKRKNFVITKKSKINDNLLKCICENFMLFNSPKELSIKYNIPLRNIQAIFSKQNFKNFTEQYKFPNVYGNKILFKFFIISEIMKTDDINELYRKIKYKNKGDLYKIKERTLWKDVWNYFISSTTIEKERINLLLSRVSDKCWVTETGDVNIFYEDIV